MIKRVCSTLASRAFVGTQGLILSLYSNEARGNTRVCRELYEILSLNVRVVTYSDSAVVGSLEIARQSPSSNCDLRHGERGHELRTNRARRSLPKVFK